jgi:hypothetical protein
VAVQEIKIMLLAVAAVLVVLVGHLGLVKVLAE